MAVLAAVLVVAPVALVAKVGAIPMVPKGRAEGAKGAVVAVVGAVLGPNWPSALAARRLTLRAALVALWATCVAFFTAFVSFLGGLLLPWRWRPSPSLSEDDDEELLLPLLRAA